MSDTKSSTPTLHEFDAPPVESRREPGIKARLVESVRLGLTVLALCSAITIVGVSADTLGEYNTTRIGGDYFLSIWPNEFDIRPTHALVACSVIILVTNMIALIASKVPAINNKPLISNSISVFMPIAALIAALIATSFFYGVNASNSTFTLKSWTCQWSNLDMDVKPHWKTLCRESKVAIYLTVMIIPLEVLVLATTAVGVFFGKRREVIHERKGSPALS